jgi:hypothetical protein
MVEVEAAAAMVAAQETEDQLTPAAQVGLVEEDTAAARMSAVVA